MKSVSTIIPAFNAAPTLARTLSSALAQTYQSHEILIIDDGSTDGSGAIADAAAARHANVTVIHQDNRGLAGARNRGIAEASGDWIAPLDADDIWHPRKLELQVAALLANPRAALAYGWFRRIDQTDRVLPGSASPRVAGCVFHRHLDDNFISNGSSPLVAAAVAREIGYDETIDACEDYLFQLRVAQRHEFACVPAYLTGYRLRPGSMSHDSQRMIRGHLAMFRLLEGDAQPAARRIIAGRIAALEVELARNRLHRGDVIHALEALGRALRLRPGAALAALATEARRTVERAWRPMLPSPGARFDHYRLDQPDGAWRSGRSARRDARLAALDRAPADRAAGDGASRPAHPAIKR